MQITPEMIAIGLTTVGYVVAFVGVIWKVDTGNKKTISTIITGQAVAKIREESHSADIVTINNKLDTIMNGESKCKLNFTGEIATLKQKTESLQMELTELKS